MKKILPLFVAMATALAIAQTPCENGSAGIFDCDGLDLQSSISLSDMNANSGNDSWGWTDTTTGNEYALIGLNNGTAFIDISDPINPIYLGKMETETNPSGWRDIKVYEDHAFVVSEAGGHGMQIFDLTRLRDVSNPPEDFSPDEVYTGFGSAHNIVINEESGFAYAVGTTTFGGGPHFINIQNPQNPVAAGGYSDDGYSHDSQVVTYNGPDSDYTGREILISSNETEVVIRDVTDKNNPTLIETIDYPNIGYTHQGWFTEDQRYFILGDELDELIQGGATRTMIFDFEDLDNPDLDFIYEGETDAIDHNGYVHNGKYYMANYTAGIRVIDVTDLENGNMEEVMSFDTHPETDDADFEGVWSVYPFFASGNIVISDINRGFLLVRDPLLANNDINLDTFTIAPNPANDQIIIRGAKNTFSSVEVFNILGQTVLMSNFDATSTKSIDVSKLTSGMYLVKLDDKTTKRLIIK